MLRQNRHRHIIQECYVGSFQLKRYRVIVNHPDLFHILVIWRIFRSVLRVHDGFDRKFYILRRERLAIMPFYVFFQMERISAVILIEFPASGKSGHYFIIAVVSGKTIKKQNIDLPMLVHGGIDSGIITAAINQRNRLFIITGDILTASSIFGIACRP